MLPTRRKTQGYRPSLAPAGTYSGFLMPILRSAKLSPNHRRDNFLNSKSYRARGLQAACCFSASKAMRLI